MRTFILVYFTIATVGAVIRAVIMSLSDYPRTTTVSVGHDAAVMIIGVAFLLWAGILLWG